MATPTKTRNDYSLKKFKVMGYNDDFTQCECCGKSDLKGTVHILDLENGIVLHFGTTCAAKADKYDSLEAAEKARVKIRSLNYVIKQLNESASSVAFKLCKELRGTAQHAIQYDIEFNKYYNDNIERVTFQWVNADQINDDLKLATAEFRNSKEYIEHHDAIETANKMKEKGELTGKERVFYFGSEERRYLSENKDVKMKAILAKYPSLKFVKYLS